MLTRQEVYDAINKERDHQDKKYGAHKEQSIAGFILVIQKELEEARDGWIEDRVERDSVLSELVQVAAVAVACLEKYGVEGSAYATDDIPQNTHRKES